MYTKETIIHTWKEGDMHAGECRINPQLVPNGL
ncbi:hypothetical protein QF041_000102 [Paenibacillus sp. W2I17]|nr:hypothetical protein [Paenibacillus sp. W2I17]